MKTRRYDGGDLRRVLTGMVTDRTVLSRVAGQWVHGGLFDSPWANMIGGWCVEHLRRYGEPPAGHLRGIVEDWARRTEPEAKTLEAVERFLSHLSDEHEREESPPSSDYLLDVAGRVFNGIRMRRLLDEAESDLDAGDVDGAHGKLAGMTRVELGIGSVTKPAEDFEAWRAAFDAERLRPLIAYPNCLQEFLGEAMVRESFVAFMGPDKSGKSMILLDAAFRACKARRRVVYFECGDMGRDATMLRLGQRTTRRPRRPCATYWPIRVERLEDGGDKVYWRKREHDEELSASESHRAFERLCRGRDLLRLSCHSNSTIGVAGLQSILSDWEREGWVPDVVVIDYADILAPPSGVRETLDQIDGTWKALRRLSQENHCLVLTATQSSAAAYATGTRVLGRRHFSGRKTKLAEVRGMIGITSGSDDAKKSICCLNWVVRGEGEFNERRWVTVAGCLAAACPVVRARD